MALYLKVPVPAEIEAAGDPDAIKEAELPINLDKIGFEYGDCERIEVEGDIKWFELEYTQINGLQFIAFEDASTTYEFGYKIDGQAKVTKRYEFDDKKQWIGLHGTESKTGIEKLGVITMDPSCKPIGGKEIIVPDVTPVVPPEEPIVTPVTAPVTTVSEDSDDSMLLYIIIGGAVVVIAVIVLVILCLRKKR